MRRFWDVVGMFVLGAVALSLPAWLFDVRAERPLHPRAELAAAELAGETAQSAARDTATVVAEGVRGAIASARQAFAEQRRSDGVHALDAALRAARVARHGLEPKMAFAEAVHQLEMTRRVLQNGRPGQAPAHLTTALRSLENVQPRRADNQPPANLSAYRDTRLIAPDGTPLGEILAVGDGWVSIATGNRDIFGVLDWPSGEPRRVPIGQFVFGKVNRFDATMTAMAPE